MNKFLKNNPQYVFSIEIKKHFTMKTFINLIYKHDNKPDYMYNI